MEKEKSVETLIFWLDQQAGWVPVKIEKTKFWRGEETIGTVCRNKGFYFNNKCVTLNIYVEISCRQVDIGFGAQ